MIDFPHGPTVDVADPDLRLAVFDVGDGNGHPTREAKMSNKRTVGRMGGCRIARLPLREVMPAADSNPWLWFAWDDDGDLLVAGVPTRRELADALGEGVDK